LGRPSRSRATLYFLRWACRIRVRKSLPASVLDALGLTNDTLVFYSTDNGPHMNTWPDAGMTPFRNEKNSN
jgi:hypothetical protein